MTRPRLILYTLLATGVFCSAGRSYGQSPPQSPELSRQALASSAMTDEPKPREILRQELHRLELICDRLSLQSESEVCRNWLQPQRPDQQRFYLPTDFPPVSEPPDSARWREHFVKARRQYAESLFGEAIQAAQTGDESRAFRLLWQVLRENPEHTQAHKLLAPYPTALASRPQRRTSTSTNELQGLGPMQRWQSRHFEVTSRASGLETQELLANLERLYAILTQVFYDFWAPTGTLDARLTKKKVQWPDHKRLEVVYFADREEYLKVLGLAESNIGVSVGYYNSLIRRSFFYHTQDNFETIAHELTHQFLAEACRFPIQSAKLKDDSDGSDSQPLTLDKVAGAWCIEGIALYMESLRQTNEGWTLGGIDAKRLQTARYRALRDLYWPDWDEFTGESITDWKETSAIALLYSQAAGLTHTFFDLHPDQPASRNAYIRYLASIYAGNPSADELRELLGEDAKQSAARYRELMTIDDRQLELLASDKTGIQQLVLSRSQLKNWKILSAFTDLEWLDVSFSNFESEDTDAVSELYELRRLSLEGTQLDNQVLEIIARLPKLEELDLSQCKIDDDGVKHLAGHANLAILWLSQTQVTDEVLETLQSLPKLRQCEVSQTQISAHTWNEFIDKHPYLKKPSP